MNTEVSALSALLACPRCDHALDRTQRETLECKACGIDFPLLDSIPWLFAEPAAATEEWCQRFTAAIKSEERLASSMVTQLERNDLSELTRQRLENGIEAHRFQAAALTRYLQPLGAVPFSGDLASYLALRTRLPPDQGLNTYYPNIHRDWAWGDDENRLSADLVCAAAGDREQPELRVLVLGAGACRLAYDVHRRITPALTVALDFNPLLLLLAQEITAGRSVELFEFPIAPKTLRQHAIKRSLKTDPAGCENLEFVLGDALRPPFVHEAFDLVITPWLIDIVSEQLSEFAPRVNRLLAPSGQWISFGSLAFRHNNPADCLSLEESLATIAAAGFSEPEVNEQDIPYMNSPASRHSRVESVVTLAARKTKTLGQVAKHRALPDYIVTGKGPVPASELFQMQAATTRIHAFIMSLIDGKRSLEDMAELMEQQQLMSRNDARGAIRGFLIKMFDESRRYSGY